MEGKVKHIKRNMMLKQIDIKFLPNGTRHLFSIKFVTKLGYLHFFPKAYATGLRYSLKDARQRGIQECDSSGKKIGHVYPVGIDLVIMFNQMEVIL